MKKTVIFLLLVFLSIAVLGEWKKIVDQDLLTGGKRVVFYTSAIAQDYQTYSEKPTLGIVLDYETKIMGIVVDWCEYISNSDHQILYRFDDQPIIQTRWNPVSDNTASSHPIGIIDRSGKTIYDFLKSLLRAKKFAIRVQTFDGSTLTAQFDVGGLNEMIKDYLLDIEEFETKEKFLLLMRKLINFVDAKDRMPKSINELIQYAGAEKDTFKDFDIKYAITSKIESSRGLIVKYTVNFIRETSNAKYIAEKLSEYKFSENLYDLDLLISHLFEKKEYNISIKATNDKVILNMSPIEILNPKNLLNNSKIGI